ncbi:MAG: hypothetical protein JWN70_1836 [Planctomycetaceae bacterium]|nr:hypothetical protein [Planctomycetaceae bacterium]
MSSGDFMELISVLGSVPLATCAWFFWIVTTYYVYLDVERRSKSRLFAVAFAIAIATYYWPISFLAYLACTASLDRRPVREPAV